MGARIPEGRRALDYSVAWSAPRVESAHELPLDFDSFGLPDYQVMVDFSPHFAPR